MRAAARAPGGPAAAAVGGAGAAPGAEERLAGAVASRASLVALCLLFAVVVGHVYSEVLVGARVFRYMGVVGREVGLLEKALFYGLAVVPALWLPAGVSRPSHVVVLYLYFTVLIPTAALLPAVSAAPVQDQLVYLACLLLSFVLLAALDQLPPVVLPSVAVSPRAYWVLFAGLCAGLVLLLLPGAYVQLPSVAFLEVYERRFEVMRLAPELGPLFFYAANWAGYAVGPFLVSLALLRRNPALAALGLAIVLVAFVASSNRVYYMGVAAVLFMWACLRFRPAHVAHLMAAGFVLVGLACVALDRILWGADGVPLVTFTLFHRVFTNNGFLSAVYLDYFLANDPSYYLDSLLRWAGSGGGALPYQQQVGKWFSDAEGVHANANLWSDGFANLRHAGVFVATLMLLAAAWLMDSVARGKDGRLAALVAVMPAVALSNTAVQTTVTTHGLAVALLLLHLYPQQGWRRPRPPAGAGAGAPAVPRGVAGAGAGLRGARP